MRDPMNACGFEPQIAIPPGETIREMIEARGMNQAQLAARMGRPRRLVSQLISGKVSITPETACELEAVLGPSAEFWMNLEYGYQLARARAVQQAEFREEGSLPFPYGEMAKLGWVPNTRDATERVLNLRAFFNVASLQCVQAVEPVAWRKARGKYASPEAIAAWLRQGERLALAADVADYDREAFQAAIPELRRLTLKADLEAMRHRCAEVGVTLLFVPRLSRTRICGAARWLRGERPVIQLTNRGQYEDILWFTLFHECAHILRHPRRLFVDVDENTESSDADSAACASSGPDRARYEREANAFARETLLPQQDFDAFVDAGDYSPDAVRKFARRMGIPPAVVVGRLVNDERLGYRTQTYKRLLPLRRKRSIPSEAEPALT